MFGHTIEVCALLMVGALLLAGGYVIARWRSELAVIILGVSGIVFVSAGAEMLTLVLGKWLG